MQRKCSQRYPNNEAKIGGHKILTTSNNKLNIVFRVKSNQFGQSIRSSFVVRFNRKSKTKHMRAR